MNEIELLEMLNLQVVDFQTSVALHMAEDAVRQDATAGFLHLIMAGIAVQIMLLAWTAVMVTRR